MAILRKRKSRDDQQEESGGDHGASMHKDKRAKRASRGSESPDLQPEEMDRLSRLPEELLVNVMARLSKASLGGSSLSYSLSQLCRTSQKLGRIATEQLYTNLVICVEECSSTDSRLTTPNRGHRHIRALEFEMLRAHDCPQQEYVSALALVKQMLPLLAENSLRSFITPRTLPLDMQLMRALQKRQKKLQHLQIGPFTGPSSTSTVTHEELMELLATGWLTSLSSLVIPPMMGNVVCELAFYGQIIRNLNKIVRVKIEAYETFDGFSNGNHGEGQLLSQNPLHTQHSIFQLLSRPSEGSAKVLQSPVQVEFLNLTSQRLNSGASLSPWIPRLFDLLSLQHLSLISCRGTSTMLQYLAQYYTHMRKEDARSPCLRSFRYRSGGLVDPSAWPEAQGESSGLHTFLRSFAGLEFLIVQSYRQWEFDLSCLHTHLDTLAHLCISVGFDFVERTNFTTFLRWIPSSEELWPVLRKASNLQQLALAFPRIYTHERSNQEFQNWLDAIAELPNLRVLRLLNWPLSKLPSVTEDTMTEYEWELYELADFVVRSIFATFSAKQKKFPLKLLIIGNDERLDNPAGESGLPLPARLAIKEEPRDSICFKILTSTWSDRLPNAVRRTTEADNVEPLFNRRSTDCTRLNYYGMYGRDPGIGFRSILPRSLHNLHPISNTEQTYATIPFGPQHQLMASEQASSAALSSRQTSSSGRALRQTLQGLEAPPLASTKRRSGSSTSPERTPATSPSLDGLPNEILAAIASLLDDHDLTSLCLTTAWLNPIATEVLYRHLNIDLDLFEPASGVLTDGNRGHRSIRTLDLCFLQHDYEYGKERWEYNLALVKRILSFLRQDHLLDIDLPYDFAVDIELVSMLRSQQTKLQHLSIGPILGARLKDLRALATPESFPELVSLVVPQRLSSEHELTFYGLLIRNHKKLSNLEIRPFNVFLGFDTGTWNRPTEKREIKTDKGSVFERISRPFEKPKGGYHPPVKVTRLLLATGTDDHTAAALLKIVDFPSLEHLIVTNCGDQDLLLRELARHSSTSEGLSLRSLRHRGWRQINGVLDSFLRTFAGLETLFLRYTNQGADARNFDLSALDTHLPTIEHLYILMASGFQSHTWWTAQPSDLQRMCRAAQNIQQLGLTFPEMYLGETDPARNERLQHFLDAILELPNLRLLRMLSWPRTTMKLEGGTRGMRDDYVRVSRRYEIGLEAFAKNVMTILAEQYRQKKKAFPIELFVLGIDIDHDQPWDVIGGRLFGGRKDPICFRVESETADVASDADSGSVESSSNKGPVVWEISGKEAGRMYPAYCEGGEVLWSHSL
ncbi:uncharacterized protein LTR77_002707 [Saxophila tyrrhenica]|uniref:F-box domain-containing protein n=1 Tax=Saxophila tyrrhenica TaxID=1690608 RepID=A0AAV9PFT2_9PEZI|nr:hypothetical protein LTR77_002707 [Saxophila tyrrhenica]